MSREKKWDRFFIDFATPVHAVNGNGSMEMDIENLGSKEGPRGGNIR